MRSIITGQVLSNFLLLFDSLRLQDFVDLFLVWLIVYQALILTRRSGAVHILLGMGVLAVGYLTSEWFDLVTMNWLLEKFFSNLFIIVVILFQGEIRAALAHLGSNRFLSDLNEVQETHVVEEIAKAAMGLAQKGHGALIVIEREIALDYFIEVGTKIDSSVSSDLLYSIFHPDSPLHDGAIVIRRGRVDSASCFLPLTKNPIIDKNLGARHRAAIGLTEETDAIVLVVSEETNAVNIALDGQIISNVDQAAIRQKMYELWNMSEVADRVKV